MIQGIKVLITAVGAPGAPGIIRSLDKNGERQIKLIGVDMDKHAVGFAMVDTCYVVPSGMDEDYIPKMIKIVEQEDPDVILPLATYELQNLAGNISLFEAMGVRIAVSDADNLEIANNKGKISQKLREVGLPSPESVMIEEIEEFIDAVERLGYPEKPVCFKPQVGKGSIGFRVLMENVDRYELLFNRKPENVYVTLDEALTIFKSKGDIPKLVVMEYLPGREYSVDVLCKNGHTYYALPRSRDLIKLGISFAGVVEKNDQLIELSKAIVRETNLSYNINMQFKYDAEDVPKLIEINPRVSGTIFLCTAAGINMPYLSIKLALGEEIPELEPLWGTKLVRYWDGIFYDKNGHAFTF